MNNSIVSYIQIDAMPIIILVLLYLNAKANFSRFTNIRRFCILTLLMIAILFTDSITWYLLEKPEQYSQFLIWGMNILYYCLTELISYMWFLYVYHQLYGESISKQQITALKVSILPLIIICLIICSSPLTHMIFYIDENNAYQRGNLYLLQMIIGFGYMTSASVLALLRRRKEHQFERQKECGLLAAVTLLPYIGGTLQILNYHMILLWPFATIAIFLLYANFQRTKISLDNLTGLNNRGRLEQYLQQRCQETHSSWYLFFMDIDKFKTINDRFGHTQGDDALRLMADVLRETFGVSNAFLSRYGGDEFAVAMSLDSDSQANQMIAQLEQNLNRVNQTGTHPFELHVSVGFARWNPDIMHCFDDITRLADENMYRKKVLRAALRNQ